MPGQNNTDYFSKLPPEIVAEVVKNIDDKRSKNSLRETSYFFQEVVESLPESGKDWRVINDISQRVSPLRELQEVDRTDAIAGIGQGWLQHRDAGQRGQIVDGALELQGRVRVRAIQALHNVSSIADLRKLGVPPFNIRPREVQMEEARKRAGARTARRIPRGESHFCHAGR